MSRLSSEDESESTCLRMRLFLSIVPGAGLLSAALDWVPEGEAGLPCDAPGESPGHTCGTQGDHGQVADTQLAMDQSRHEALLYVYLCTWVVCVLPCVALGFLLALASSSLPPSLLDPSESRPLVLLGPSSSSSSPSLSAAGLALDGSS